MIINILLITGIIALLWFAYSYAFAEQGIIHIVKLNENLEMEDEIDKKYTWKFKVEIKKTEIVEHWLNFHCKSRYTEYRWSPEARCQF